MGLEQLKVEYNHHCGDDLAVVNAARKSFNKKSDWEWNFDGGASRRLKPADARLIRFLARGMSSNDFEDLRDEIVNCGPDDVDLIDFLWKWRHTPIHDTPFNHCFISFNIKAPIFVARQLVKTEYMPFSEQSGRYIILDELYRHDYRQQGENRKQGSLDELHPENGKWQLMAGLSNAEALEVYKAMVDDGVAIEQARGVLPVDTMTSWTWSGTLGAVAKMCRERLDSHAQRETRHVAGLIYDELKQRWSVSAPALVEGPC
jgi:thymidylate synthase (FAD)